MEGNRGDFTIWYKKGASILAPYWLHSILVVAAEPHEHEAQIYGNLPRLTYAADTLLWLASVMV